MKASGMRRRMVSICGRREPCRSDGASASAPCRCRLQGYVEVWGKPLRLGYEGDNLVGEQVGLNRGDAVVRDALDLVERADEVEEGLARLFAEVADVHPRDDNLLTPGGSHFASLCGELLDGAAAAPAPGKGYGAVGAEVVAAVLYLEEVAGAVAPRTRGRELADVAGRGGNHLAHLLPLVQVAQVLQDVELLFGTQNQVHVGDVGNLVGFELRIAAGHHDKGLRVLPAMRRMVCRHFLSASSVTEQVLITQMSAFRRVVPCECREPRGSSRWWKFRQS